MRKTLFLIVSIGFFFFLRLLTPSLVSAQWTPAGTGVDYQEFHLPDPNNVFVARMDRANPGVTLESSIAQGKLATGKETVSGMASRYDQAINFWGQSWGQRNDVVAAINGSFHDTTTGIPESGQVHSGWYAKRFDDLGGGSGFAWKLDRTAFLGACVYHRPEKQIITYTATGNTQQFAGINFTRGTDELIIYTPQYDNDTNTDDSGVEVLVEMARPTLILPTPAMAKGYVREIRSGQGSTPIPFDHIVLSATGSAATALLANVSVGGEIGISQEITSYESDCVTHLPVDWTKTYASISGSFDFLNNGVIQNFNDPGATERDPRTAIAFDGNYIYFIVVDGRDPARSVGMTIEELANFTKNTLGATWGTAQDGGGSSVMVVNGAVVNRPSDGSERPVGNGMLMVAVEPKVQSTMFALGEAVTTLRSTDVRLGPGTNYGILATVPADSQGTVVSPMNNLNGVLAKGSYWWKVAFGVTVGWVSEESLAGSVLNVSSITYITSGGRNSTKDLLVTVSVVDSLGQAVPDALVFLDLYRDGKKVKSFSKGTNTNGTVTYTLKNAASGCYTSTITNVMKNGFIWDGVTPLNRFCK